VVDILEARRACYAKLEPRFWKRAARARENSIGYLATLLPKDDHLFLVATVEAAIAGFILCVPMRTPPVYDAGPTAAIDDYHVADPADWPTIGAALLAAARGRLKANGINQIVVVSAYLDEPKMAFLRGAGLSLNAAWFNAPTGAD
jgi:GNAT superfamily N-acetyltransferase